MALIRRVWGRLRRAARGWLAGWRPGEIVALDDHLWRCIDPEARLERIACGFRFTEGPVWLPQAQTLLFSDIPADRIYAWDGARIAIFRSPSHKANGLALDRHGRLLMCEHATRRLSRQEADGTTTILTSSYGGQRLNSPNDAIARSDGLIYFTDPPYGIRPEQQELPHQGVYALNPDTGTLTLVTADLDHPNGLAFSPDEALLYVDDSASRHIYVFDVRADGRLENRRLFCDMGPEGVPMGGNPDGMTVDYAGHLYCSGPGGVWILDPAGRQLGLIAMREKPSNCAWGDIDRCTLYITAQTSLYRLRVQIGGAIVEKHHEA